jgi:ketosteroid isomerase-like protein
VVRFPQSIAAPLALACGCSSRPPAVDARAEEAAVREADGAWLKALDARQLDDAVSFYAGDASVLGPNVPVMTGKDAIRKFWSDEFAPTVALRLRCQTFKVEAARSGDLGYGQGTYEATYNDSKGNPVKDHGKYVVVWKKQPDGKWKVITDTYNSDAPLATPPVQ